MQKPKKKLFRASFPPFPPFFPGTFFFRAASLPLAVAVCMGLGKKRGKGQQKTAFSLTHTNSWLAKKEGEETLFRLLDCKLLPQRLRKKEGGGGGGRAACGKTLACEEGGGTGIGGVGIRQGKGETTHTCCLLSIPPPGRGGGRGDSTAKFQSPGRRQKWPQPLQEGGRKNKVFAWAFPSPALGLYSVEWKREERSEEEKKVHSSLFSRSPSSSLT